MNTTNSILVLLIAIAILLSSCAAGYPDAPVCDQELYKEVAAEAINVSASFYVKSITGEMPPERASEYAHDIWVSAKQSPCSGPAVDIVNDILMNTWYAIDAEADGGITLANTYIDRAFNATNQLKTQFGWRI